MREQCYSLDSLPDEKDHNNASKDITSRIFLEDNVFVAEVKSTNDQASAQQRQWAELLVDIGVCSFLFKIYNDEYSKEMK